MNTLRTPLRLLPMMIVLGGLLVLPTIATARPVPSAGNTIPAAQPPQAIAAGTQAVGEFLNNFGDLSISVAVVEVNGEGQLVPAQSTLVRALGAEVESQLAKYTGNQVNILSIEVSPERAQRVLSRQNISTNPSDTFVREVAELSSAPYLITVEVGPDTTGKASAGPVILRLVEVATGRVLTTISSQFYEDRERFSDINTATWVQHSVTYWMNEMMGWDNRQQTVSGGLPAALNGPFLMRLQFTGTIPRRDRVKLKEAVATATGVQANRINLQSSKENGLDVATANIRLEQPPHFVVDDVVFGIEDAMKELGLNAQPLRENGGDLIFAINATPVWWKITGGDSGDENLQAWKTMLKDHGGPSIAVVKYADPNVIRLLADKPEGAALAGAGSVMVASIEAQLRDLGADVIAVEQSRVDVSRYPWGSAKDVKQAMPVDLRQRAEWAFVVEIVPPFTVGGEPRVLARLVDMQADRVLGSAVFPATKAAVPAGEQTPDESTLAARYLTGASIIQAVAGDDNTRALDLVILESPSFDFANRVGQICRGQQDVVRTKLPSWQAGQPFSIEVHYENVSAEDFVERLRADLATLPINVGGFEQGTLTLVHRGPAAAP